MGLRNVYVTHQFCFNTQRVKLKTNSKIFALITHTLSYSLRIYAQV